MYAEWGNFLIRVQDCEFGGSFDRGAPWGNSGATDKERVSKYREDPCCRLTRKNWNQHDLSAKRVRPAQKRTRPLLTEPASKV